MSWEPDLVAEFCYNFPCIKHVPSTSVTSLSKWVIYECCANVFLENCILSSIIADKKLRHCTDWWCDEVFLTVFCDICLLIVHRCFLVFYIRHILLYSFLQQCPEDIQFFCDNQLMPWNLHFIFVHSVVLSNRQHMPSFKKKKSAVTAVLAFCRYNCRCISFVYIL